MTFRDCFSTFKGWFKVFLFFFCKPHPLTLILTLLMRSYPGTVMVIFIILYLKRHVFLMDKETVRFIHSLVTVEGFEQPTRRTALA